MKTAIERFWDLPVYPQTEMVLVTDGNIEAIKAEFPDQIKYIRSGYTVIRRILPNLVWQAPQDDDVVAAVDEHGILWGRAIGRRQMIR